jgi:hypothetical protein
VNTGDGLWAPVVRLITELDPVENSLSVCSPTPPPSYRARFHSCDLHGQDQVNDCRNCQRTSCAVHIVQLPAPPISPLSIRRSRSSDAGVAPIMIDKREQSLLRQFGATLDEH